MREREREREREGATETDRGRDIDSERQRDTGGDMQRETRVIAKPTNLCIRMKQSLRSTDSLHDNQTDNLANKQANTHKIDRVLDKYR